LYSPVVQEGGRLAFRINIYFDSAGNRLKPPLFRFLTLDLRDEQPQITDRAELARGAGNTLSFDIEEGTFTLEALSTSQ
jgi:hypothetical protein